MQTLAEILSSLPGDDVACITPEGRVTRRELLMRAESLRISGEALESPLVSGAEILTMLTRLIALDGYASSILLMPVDTDARLYANAKKQVNKQNLIRDGEATRWIIATSGTTGAPKLVTHSLQTLTQSLKMNTEIGRQLRWALIYDPCRFAGLQVVLQACISGSALLVPKTADIEELVDFLIFEGCTSISATPSMWRKMLSATNAHKLELRHITLGGEITDEKTLGRLKSKFSNAKITHIYASTEVGVGFSVKDGKAGFPAEYLKSVPGGKVELRISQQGTLLIRNTELNQTLGQQGIITDADGFIDTGDSVILQANRVIFLGRANGSINIGGQKVMPEEVEAVLRESSSVVDVRVYGKPSPVLGNVVVAEVVPLPQICEEDLKQKLFATCKERLAAFKRPAVIRIVKDIELTEAGKAKRNN